MPCWQLSNVLIYEPYFVEFWHWVTVPGLLMLKLETQVPFINVSVISFSSCKKKNLCGFTTGWPPFRKKLTHPRHSCSHYRLGFNVLVEEFVFRHGGITSATLGGIQPRPRRLHLKLTWIFFFSFFFLFPATLSFLRNVLFSFVIPPPWRPPTTDVLQMILRGSFSGSVPLF